MTSKLVSFRRKVVPGLLILAGLGILLSAFGPVALSSLNYLVNRPTKIIDPTAVTGFAFPRVVNVLGVNDPEFTSTASWYPTDTLKTKIETPANVKYYTISLPRVGLIDVPVEINGNDLKKNAIHFPGAALPGTYGNAVVIGHSALPQFYKKDNPLTIFNPLPETKIGDNIIVKFDGVTYKYEVKETAEVSPEQIEVLTQRFDRRELSLITCVPLGTYWRRFVARAEMVEL